MRRGLVAALVLASACRSPPTATERPVASSHPAQPAAPAPTVTPVQPPAPAQAPAREAPGTESAPSPSDWCIEGLSTLDEETCFLLPPLAEGHPRRLLVYFHGIVPPEPGSVQQKTVQRAVASASKRAGAAALVPRGVRGVGPKNAHDWWAWPTSPKAHAERAPAIVERLRAARVKLEAKVGSIFERVYFAGSSNGAYFVAALALRGDLDAVEFSVDGFGAMSGGTTGGYGALLARRPVHPFYLGYGAYDEESKRGALALAAALKAARWPIEVAEHPFGHGAREVYLDEAFAFWDRQAARGGAVRRP